jgi:hypothetical protein
VNILRASAGWLSFVAMLWAGQGTAQMLEPRRPGTVGAESVRMAGQYLVSRPGTVWIFQQSKGHGRISVASAGDWKVAFNYAVVGRIGSGVWRIKDGAWLERSALRGTEDAVVLPAQVSRGAQWQSTASIERGGKGLSTFEVISLDASVEPPPPAASHKGTSPVPIEHCLAVLESSDSDVVYIHYYAPHLGKVAVQAGGEWLFRLVELRGQPAAPAE